MGGPPSITYSKARSIRTFERDHALNPSGHRWPPKLAPDGWRRGNGCLERIVEPDPAPGGGSGEEAGPEPNPAADLRCRIKESILRFPSAPIHGLQRLHEYHGNVGYSENLHTLRLITHTHHEGPFNRIFLIHNGLNESDRMGLYYQLASSLIALDADTAVIVRPLPGHLTRAPFAVLGETPLDRYLWDGSHLFRQFMRYMIETRWLLSALTRRSSYRCPSGLGLLAQSHDPEKSRLDDERLASAIDGEWRSLHAASKAALRQTEHRSTDAASQRHAPRGEHVFRASVEALRAALRLERFPALDSEPPRVRTGSDRTNTEDGGDNFQDEPAIHVIGYSLGGFMAQSVFMSWPFMIGSCTTLLSGGALRELAPTAFADPEEWQTVLHSLRYELDHAMLEEPRYRARGGKIAGVEHDLFLYLMKTFYEVFQQDYRGSFQSRVAAFRRRMLFIVGGNDPIVRPESVLDSAPPGGMNMVMIGGLGHFLAGKAKDDEERQQRAFWMPELARIIREVAVASSQRLHREQTRTWLNRNMLFDEHRPEGAVPEQPGATARAEPKDGVRRLSGPERLAVARDGALPGALFQRCLDDLLARVQSAPSTDAGFLFILRNEVPTLLLDAEAIQEHAVALHHDDSGIEKYTRGVLARRAVLENRSGEKRHASTSVILPWNAKRIMLGMDAHPGHPTQAETAGGQMPRRSDPATTWEECRKLCRRLDRRENSAVSVFDGSDPRRWPPRNRKSIRKLMSAAPRVFDGQEVDDVVPSLPDCWLWVSKDFITGARGASTNDENAAMQLCDAVAKHCRDDKDGDGRTLDDFLRNDAVRLVTVSRARYNPRFRGRIVVEDKPLKQALFHAAVCIAASVSFTRHDFDNGRAGAAV